MRTGKTEVVSHARKERPGHITTKKIRVVCGSCNNGWMSTIESAVQSFATPMILGRSGVLNENQQTLLAQWATLKLMVVELNHRTEAVTTQAERFAFRESRDIPRGLRFWIAQCFSDVWCNAYFRHAATLGRDFASRPVDNRKNVHTAALGIGQLFFYAMGSAAEGVNLADLIQLGEQLVPLWPLPGGDLRWPPASAIGDREANRIAMVFDVLMRDPRVIWIR